MEALLKTTAQRMRIIAACVLCACVVHSARGENTSGVVVRAALQDEVISPAAARFIQRALREAHDQGAACFILELDTPGGLMISTHQIVQHITGSRIPVVVYVTPSGGRATSAGVFITLASHVAAMTPGTRIGAAHPVQVGGQGLPLPSEPPDDEEQENQDEPDVDITEQKIVHDAVAWARALAQMRNRNAEWAVSTVEENVSSTADEALEIGAIEIVAENLDRLLADLDGTEVRIDDQVIQLATEDAQVRSIEMWWGEEILAVLSNPNIALLLLMVGFYGILFELYSPGWGVGGTLGVLGLIAGFYGLAVLPINYAGLLLIFMGLGLFVAEAFITSFGVLTISGIVCLILGGVMLVDTPEELMQVSLGVLIPVAAATAVITVFLVTNVVKGMRSQVQTGSEALVGKSAVAVRDFAKDNGLYKGTVRLRGELWTANSDRAVAAGSTVTITSQSGLTLKVSPQQQTDTETS